MNRLEKMRSVYGIQGSLELVRRKRIGSVILHCSVFLSDSMTLMPTLITTMHGGMQFPRIGRIGRAVKVRLTLEAAARSRLKRKRRRS